MILTRLFAPGRDLFGDGWPTLGLLVAVAAGAILLAGCDHRRSPKPPAVSPEPAATSEVLALAREYQDLRNQRAHEAPGEFNKDTDAWGGRLHEVLGRLGELLGKPSCSCAEIKRIMGVPDAVQQEASGVHLVYFWRGWHDYLYFVCRNGRVIEAKWYFAYE